MGIEDDIEKYKCSIFFYTLMRPGIYYMTSGVKPEDALRQRSIKIRV